MKPADKKKKQTNPARSTTPHTHTQRDSHESGKRKEQDRTSAKQAAKALLAKVPAKEMSDLDLPSATIFPTPRSTHARDTSESKAPKQEEEGREPAMRNGSAIK